ncbi:MAG: Dihydrofolate synthase [Ignavibacteriae bacterium]|nr:MAG: Dihydrofolate synthase [Ignavibacteriota bacterium]
MGLENINRLLEKMGNPHKKFPTIHIAGSNGKGSTSAMVASILTASGYKTGLYTSPHLVSFNERIRIDGIPISNVKLKEYIKENLKNFKTIKPTFFEATTAIAFKYFEDNMVDIAVIETGMGGRLDATNVIKPLISIITSISKEHTQYLGNTLEQIAFEKAGIIKESTPCLTAVDDKKLLRIFRQVAKSKNTQIREVSKSVKLEFLRNQIHSNFVNVKFEDKIYNNLEIGLPGSYQKNNILLALSCVKVLKEKFNYSRINDKKIYSGLRNIKQLTGIRGRLEKISEDPIIVGDVAHNPEAFQYLSQSLLRLGINNATTIFGLMNDKDIENILPHLTKFSKLVIVTGANTDRAFKSWQIKPFFHNLRFPCIDSKDVENSLKIAKKLYKTGDIIVITGSHYILGEALKVLKV